MHEFTTAAQCVPERLVGWANQMAARFARPVYLVGSALALPQPRDWDVRIVIADDEFAQRYGDPREYEAGAWLPRRFPSMLGYYADMAKLTRQGVEAVRLNLDFQVHPMRFAERFRAAPRQRLDLVDGLEDVYTAVPIP